MIVQAKEPTVGKYLTINIIDGDADSGCYVIATKFSSEQIFNFTENNFLHKVGAGTVSLMPYSSEGWTFLGWSGDLIKPEDAQNFPLDLKTEKYAEITAIFSQEDSQEDHIITVLAPSGEGNIAWGEIPNNWYDVGKPLSYEITVDYGSDLTFEFIPEEGKHVSAVIVNNEYVYFDKTDTATYQFENVIENQNITAIFDDEGIVVVPEGDSILFIGNTASLSFTNVQQSGIALGIDYTHIYSNFTEGFIFWEIRTNASYIGTVTVTLKFNEGQSPIYLERADWVGDFNGDGKITGEDVSIIANAVNTNQQPNWYDPFLDVNSDGEVDKQDVHIVNRSEKLVNSQSSDAVRTSFLFFSSPNNFLVIHFIK
ncbi:MAG: dockerin type I domain-containing protein [Candidatus Bathyarchaeota archaeon]